MNGSVVIKSNKHGITLVVDEALSFPEIKEKVREKFEQSAKFFGAADMALALEGRRFTKDEQLELLQIIEASSSLNIICIIDNDEKKDEVFIQAAERNNNISDAGIFYKGTLRSGQVFESASSVIILGDVNPGGRVIAKGSVIVLGTLKGNITAGADGNENAFVVALDMDPMQIKIGSVIARSQDEVPVKKKKKFEKKPAVEPKIAYVDDGHIYIEDLNSDIISDIRID